MTSWRVRRAANSCRLPPLAAARPGRARRPPRVPAGTLGVVLAATLNDVKPAIVSRPIPYGAKRRREMAAYSKRHYGRRTARLTHPHVIVEHYTANTSFSATFNTFANDVPDAELHELPAT